MSKTKYELTYGIIRIDNSITSRDSALPETFDTEAEARAALDSYAADYRMSGYKIWFSNIKKIEVDE